MAIYSRKAYSHSKFTQCIAGMRKIMLGISESDHKSMVAKFG